MQLQHVVKEWLQLPLRAATVAQWTRQSCQPEEDVSFLGVSAASSYSCILSGMSVMTKIPPVRKLMEVVS